MCAHPCVQDSSWEYIGQCKDHFIRIHIYIVHETADVLQDDSETPFCWRPIQRTDCHKHSMSIDTPDEKECKCQVHFWLCLTTFRLMMLRHTLKACQQYSACPDYDGSGCCDFDLCRALYRFGTCSQMSEKDKWASLHDILPWIAGPVIASYIMPAIHSSLYLYQQGLLI